ERQHPARRRLAGGLRTTDDDHGRWSERRERRQHVHWQLTRPLLDPPFEGLDSGTLNKAGRGVGESHQELALLGDQQQRVRHRTPPSRPHGVLHRFGEAERLPDSHEIGRLGTVALAGQPNERRTQCGNRPHRITSEASRLALPFDVAAEVVQDRLPALTLQLRRVLGLRVEGGPHVYTLRALLEADLYFATVIHAV